MKFLIVFAAAIMAASALPAYLKEAAALNGTSARHWNMPCAIGHGRGATGGAGGAVWTVWDAWALRDAVAGNAARLIYVRGRIDLTVLFTGSPGVVLVPGPHKSLIGDNGSMIVGGSLRFWYVWNCIVFNIKFHNALSYAPGEQPNGSGGIVSMVPGAWSALDAIDIEGCESMCIQHCEFADDPWVSNTVPENQRRHHGLIGIKAGASFISISNNIFRNHNLCTLAGHSDGNGAQDVGRLRITYNNNWFMGTTQRNPMVRFGEVHVLNNLYTDIIDYGIGVHTGASIYAERNVFINTRSAWAFPDATPNPIGNLINVDNRFVNSQFSSAVPSNVGWNPSQHYFYSPLAVGNVESNVRTFAGTIW